MFISSKSEAYIANVGDSCAHIVTASGTEKLTYDHKGSDPAERARIEATGAMVLRDRIEG